VSVLCTIVGNRVAALEGEQGLPRRLDGHVSSCLRCQAVQARDRRMRRALSRLALQRIAAPRGLLAAVESAIVSGPTAAAATHGIDRARKRITRSGALAGMAAFAAGGAAVAAWHRVRRPA
jgi:hypothetical protein